MKILYSTGCPKCKILKMKLDEANIEYTENNDIDTMLDLGFSNAPVLVVDDQVMNYEKAIMWIQEQ